MKFVSAFLFGFALYSPMVWADDSESSDDDLSEQTISGQRVAVPVEADIEDENTAVDKVDVAPASIRPYPDKVYEGARVLNMDVEFVNTCYQAIEMVYKRQYA
tara:strand:- start:371 stop:679 length:309 start_codon:yes stop_codon:yes gene_type:complete